MSDHQRTMTAPSNVLPRRRWGSLILKVIAGLALALTATFLVAQRMSDGPLNAMIPGGPLRAGDLVTQANVDWDTVINGGDMCADGACPEIDAVALQFEDPAKSRWVGVMVHEGQLYVPCDLGYMWGRLDGAQSRMLHLIYLFKNWHTNALEDGRAVLRINGNRYERQAVLVTDETKIASLKVQLEGMAREWLAPAELGPPPTEGPRDIWFFRMDPRTS